jgi:hypothetical protein
VTPTASKNSLWHDAVVNYTNSGATKTNSINLHGETALILTCQQGIINIPNHFKITFIQSQVPACSLSYARSVNSQGLHSNASLTRHITWHQKRGISYELETVWKETIVKSFKELFQYLS